MQLMNLEMYFTTSINFPNQLSLNATNALHMKPVL